VAPDVDALEEDFSEFGVKFVTSLSDVGSPYSASQWQSNFGDSETPLVLDANASSVSMFGLLHDSWNAYPTFALIDHTMTVRAKPWTLSSNSNSNSCDGNSNTINGFSGGNTSDFIQQLVDECGFLCEPCSGTMDSDGDGIADECDDCNNMIGDVTDDYIIDILDIVNVVNMVLTGGFNSPDFTDCAKSDADMTGDGTINILDVIQIINAVLGNLNQIVSSSDYIDVVSEIKGEDLYLTFISDDASGLELRIAGDISDINLIDNTNAFTLSNNINTTDKVSLIYSMQNQTFDKSLTIQIVDGAKLDTNSDIYIVAGNVNGDKMLVRWLDERNFSITSLYPNPFNPVTQIDYSVDYAGELRLSVYNILGQEVAVLHSGYQTEGDYQAVWNAGSLASGVYYINMMMHGQVETKKAVLIK